MTRLREFEQGSRNALHASLRVLADAYTGDPDGFYTRQAIPTTEGVVSVAKEDIMVICEIKEGRMFLCS